LLLVQYVKQSIEPGVSRENAFLCSVKFYLGASVVSLLSQIDKICIQSKDMAMPVSSPMFGLARLPGSVVQTFGLGRYNELLRFLSVSGPISGDEVVGGLSKCCVIV